MGLVLWIDSNTFATGLLERVYKQRGLPFYALETAADFSYLIEDLRPVVLVIDVATAKTAGDALRLQYATAPLFRTLPVITIDGSSEVDFLENRIGQINRPFDPFQIPDIIQAMLGQL